jgi:hypothetical protein
MKRVTIERLKSLGRGRNTGQTFDQQDVLHSFKARTSGGGKTFRTGHL